VLALTFLVAGPWVLPGFLFGTDWPGPRTIPWPTQFATTWPLQILLATCSKLVSAELTAKLLILGTVFTAAFLAYGALPVGDFIPRCMASLIYVLNPFVYGRLHYGQLFLLGGYAVLPWVASRIHQLVKQPDRGRAFGLAASLLVLGAFSPHLILLASFLVAISAVFGALFQRMSPPYVVRLGRSLVTTFGMWLIFSTYWLVPYLAGESVESKVVAQVSSGDLLAFRSVADPTLGLFPNLLGLYGFWAENVGRFPSLKLFVPYWYLALLGLLFLAAPGVISILFIHNSPFRDLRGWVITLVVVGIIALVLEAGVAEPHIAPLVGWLDRVFPPYRGMRDAGKWAALLAVVYAQVVPLGLVATRDWLERNPSK